jgi:hypothetical protein
VTHAQTLTLPPTGETRSRLTSGGFFVSQEPETVYHDTPKGLGDNPEASEYIPKDVGNSAGDGEGQDEQEHGYRKTPVASLTPGGLGSGGLVDVKTIGQAVRERWPIPAHVRAGAAVWLAEVAQKAKDRRARVNAVKVLAELDKLNMAQEDRDNGGEVKRLDITSGGKPLGQPDLSKLTDAEIERLIAEREKGLPG